MFFFINSVFSVSVISDLNKTNFFILEDENQLSNFLPFEKSSDLNKFGIVTYPHFILRLTWRV